MNTKVGRNDPCPCGSGKKYKNCCMLQQEESKKLYSPSGKRKFKAKVIDANATNASLFNKMTAETSASGDDQAILEKLRFRMTEHNYQTQQKADAPKKPTEEIAQPSEGDFKPGATFNEATDDFRVEEK